MMIPFNLKLTFPKNKFNLSSNWFIFENIMNN